jgi:hypothetical protein
MNVNSFDSLYRERSAAYGVTGASIILETKRVNPGRIRVLTHVSIENKTNSYTKNKTNSYTKCRLSIYNGAVDFMIDEAIYPGEDELLVHPKDILLGEGDILRATLTGTTTADELELHAIGWEMPRE